MLSISAIGRGTASYYSGMGREDYYVAGGEPPGTWHGEASEALGLRGIVTASALEALFAGFGTNGKPLVQNAGKSDHQVGWDLTFSAPKSFSILWGTTTNDAFRQRLERAHAKAVLKTLEYIERNLSFSRRGSRGERTEPAKLVAALYEHSTSRNLDPQRHTHILLLNVGVRPDGSTGTIVSKRLFENKLLLGAIYRAELAAALVHDCRLAVVRYGRTFEIAQVARAAIKRFSSRRSEILQWLAERGLSGAAASHIAALDTRTTKGPLLRHEELRGLWRKQLRSLGPLERLRPSTMPRVRKGTFEIIDSAARDLAREQSHFTQEELRLRALAMSVEHGIGSDHILTAMRHPHLASRQLISLGRHGTDLHYTTRRTRKLELAVVRVAQRLAGTRRHGAAADHVHRVLTSFGRPLSAEQVRAVEHLTSLSAGSIRIVEGFAGTGKTTLLDAARRVWELDGYRVIGVAVSGKVTNELRSDAGIQAFTFRQLAMMLRPSFKWRVSRIVRNVFRAALKRPALRDGRLRIDPTTVLVADEAGTLTTRQWAELVRAATRDGGLLVAIGDRKQLQPIGPGGMFGQLVESTSAPQLTSIVRQRNAADRDLAHAAAAGDASQVIDNLQRRKRLECADTPVQAIELLLSRWFENDGLDPKNALILAPTRATVADLNRRCQEMRRNRGVLDARKFAQVGSSRFHVGDRILFTKTDRRLGVANGELGTLKAIHPLLPRIQVQRDNGELTWTNTRKYSDIELGYAMTTHKAQGTTTVRAYALLGGPMQDRELSYVQLTRAREAVFCFTDRQQAGERLQRLTAALERSRQQTLSISIDGGRLG
ncbi:MAG: hypothetical protein AMXMBFR47_23240 [Planctomycetota bacterium]